MGIFDTFHSGYAHSQTKAFDPAQRDIAPGDYAKIFPRPRNAKEQNAYYRHVDTTLPLTDFQVFEEEVGFITVKNNIIQDRYDRDSHLQLFDHLGHELIRPPTALESNRYPTVEVTYSLGAYEITVQEDDFQESPITCDICAKVRRHEYIGRTSAYYTYKEITQEEYQAQLDRFSSLRKVQPPDNKT